MSSKNDNETPSCSGCDHCWDVGHLECRVQGPHSFAYLDVHGNPIILTWWPQVQPTDGCSEFYSKEERRNGIYR